MKRILFTFASLLFLIQTLSFAQETEGTIVYKETVKMEMKFEGPEAERMMARMPRERSMDMQLQFNTKNSFYSLYETDVEDTQEMSFTSAEGQARQVRMVMRKPDNQIFVNLDNLSLTEKREFMGKNFLIEENLKDLKWKLTGEQKEIAGYACQKAIYSTEKLTVEAWFAPQIPVKAGPSSYAGLPGMIMEINENEGKKVITATAVTFGEIDSSTLKTPKSGKKVTREEFRQLVEEKMKENGGGGQRMMIRTVEH